jgi:phospholipase C
MASALDRIDTIVVVILENRSFDHMLGYLSLPDPGQTDVDGLGSDPGWLRAHANSGIEPFEFAAQEIDDPPHEKATIAIQIGTPAVPGGPNPMNGFVESYRRRHPPPSDERLVMGYYTAATLPVFDFFARNYTLCDHWFASIPTGTQANRLMAMSGTTSIVDNASILLPNQELVYDWLTERHVSWCVYQYGDFLPFFSLMPKWIDEIGTSLALDALVPHAHPRFRRFSNFGRDWSTEQNIPSVIFIEPEYTDGPHAGPNDDHPPTGVMQGQAFVRDIYNALIGNPTRWARTLLIITYDEHGGFYDHVPPLAIPTRVPGHGPGPVFQTTGVRVPAFIISPFVEAGAVHRGPLEHTSMLQLLADKFANGVYSAAVYDRQPGLSRISETLARTEPRTDPPIPPAVTLSQVVARSSTSPAFLQRAPGASANAAAFKEPQKKSWRITPALLPAGRHSSAPPKSSDVSKDLFDFTDSLVRQGQTVGRVGGAGSAERGRDRGAGGRG